MRFPYPFLYLGNMKLKKIRLNTLFVMAAVAAVICLGALNSDILNAAPGTLKVLYPNGGETLKKGSNIEIKWRSGGLTPNDKVVILLYKKGIKHSVIAGKAPNSGRHRWKVPGRLPMGKDYRIRIRVLKKLSVNDFSDRNFSIK